MLGPVNTPPSIRSPPGHEAAADHQYACENAWVQRSVGRRGWSSDAIWREGRSTSTSGWSDDGLPAVKPHSLRAVWLAEGYTNISPVDDGKRCGCGLREAKSCGVAAKHRRQFRAKLRAINAAIEEGHASPIAGIVKTQRVHRSYSEPMKINRGRAFGGGLDRRSRANRGGLWVGSRL